MNRWSASLRNTDRSDRGGLLRLFAHHRLGALPRDRGFGGSAIVRGHGARRRFIAAGRYPNPVPHADVVTKTTHKTLRGPRGRTYPGARHPELHKKLNSMVFPGIQGGPLMHVIAAKAAAFQEALQPGVQKPYSAQLVANAASHGRSACSDAATRSSRGAPTIICSLLDLVDKNVTGKDADAALERAHMTVNKNAVPNDPRPPGGDQRSSHRLAGDDHARVQEKPEVEQVAHWIADFLEHMGDESTLDRGTRRGRVAVPPLPCLWLEPI